MTEATLSSADQIEIRYRVIYAWAMNPDNLPEAIRAEAQEEMLKIVSHLPLLGGYSDEIGRLTQRRREWLEFFVARLLKEHHLSLKMYSDTEELISRIGHTKLALDLAQSKIRALQKQMVDLQTEQALAAVREQIPSVINILNK